MQDEMTITVIAAGFGEPKSVINARAEKQAQQAAPVVEEVPVMQAPTPKPVAKPSVSDEDDLDAIFKILDNKK